jgi:hypothetical protein
VKEVPKTTLEIAPTHFLKLLDHIISTIHYWLILKHYLDIFKFFDNFLPIQLEADPI